MEFIGAPKLEDHIVVFPKVRGFKSIRTSMSFLLPLGHRSFTQRLFFLSVIVNPLKVVLYLVINELVGVLSAKAARLNVGALHH